MAETALDNYFKSILKIGFSRSRHSVQKLKLRLQRLARIRLFALSIPPCAENVGKPLPEIPAVWRAAHPDNIENALLTPGGIAAIAYAINHPGIVGVPGTDEYNNLMDLFQDWIPYELIDCSQWWIGHYWSSGHRCNECRQLVELFRCDELTPDQRLQAASLRSVSDHAPDCSARKISSFEGVRVCLSFHGG
jgi:hypothetical protein